MGIFSIVVGVALMLNGVVYYFRRRKQPQKKHHTSTLGLS
jgi:heme/copper-type cytochrome/quinol oxidase subunit 2